MPLPSPHPSPATHFLCLTAMVDARNPHNTTSKPAETANIMYCVRMDIAEGDKFAITQKQLLPPPRATPRSEEERDSGAWRHGH